MGQLESVCMGPASGTVNACMNSCAPAAPEMPMHIYMPAPIVPLDSRRYQSYSPIQTRGRDHISQAVP